MTYKYSPFIIWTFRRTGGTNLSQSLFFSSIYKPVEHEPFNSDRIYKYVVKDWKENRDVEQLYAHLEKILEQKPLIKHCLEIMPGELNEALLDISTRLGYKHLFLYREEAKSRLLSLNYSLKTNIWGKDHLTTRTFDQIVFNENIPILKLIKHEEKARSSMRGLYEKLIDMGESPLAVSFEQLYKSEFDYSSLLVRKIFNELIGSDEDVTRDFLERMLKGGEQGTNNDYQRFPNSQDFIIEIEKLPRFTLYGEHKVDCFLSNDLDVEYMEVWSCLPGVKSNQFFVHGVLLSNDSFSIKGMLSNGFLIRELPSARIAKMYPMHPKSKNCRFIYGPIYKNEKVNFYKINS